MDRTINDKNCSIEYIKYSLVRKFFNLAMHLTKFKICQLYLNQAPPKHDKFFIYQKQIIMDVREEKANLMQELKEGVHNDKDAFTSEFYTNIGDYKREMELLVDKTKSSKNNIYASEDCTLSPESRINRYEKKPSFFQNPFNQISNSKSPDKSLQDGSFVI